MMRTIVMSLLVTGLVFGPLGTVNAEKGGNRSVAKYTAPGTTLVSSCDETNCVVGEPAYFWGDGYDASQAQALLHIAGGYSVVAVASDGSVDFSFDYFQIPGDYSVQLYQNGKGRKLELKSELTVTVE